MGHVTGVLIVNLAESRVIQEASLPIKTTILIVVIEM